MSELTDKFKLSVRSVGLVHEALNAMVSRLRTTGAVEYRGKMTREALVNAAILYLDTLPEPQKVAALRIGLARLEGNPAVAPQPAVGPVMAQPIPPQTGRRIPRIRKSTGRTGTDGT